MQYNPHKTADLIWENALDVASCWEVANDFQSRKSSSFFSNSSEENAKEEVQEQETTMIAAVEESALASLSDWVLTNEKSINQLMEAQQQLSEEISEWKEEISAKMNQILSSELNSECNGNAL